MTPFLFLLPALAAPVDVSLTPALQDVPPDCFVEVELVLSAASATTVTSLDALISWDPGLLDLINVTPSPDGWLAAGFLNDPDGINSDVSDGDALFRALSGITTPLVVSTPHTVATFEFQVLDDGDVSLLASLGSFGVTAVYGELPGQNVTGVLSGPASATATPVATLVASRVGSPPNPEAFMVGGTTPFLGSLWDPFVDHTTFEPAAIGDFIVFSPVQINLDLVLHGTLLVGLPVIDFIPVNFSPGTPFAIPIPDECILVGVTLSAQAGSSSDGVDFQLANALDITFGTF